MRLILSGFCLIALGACSNASMVASAFPDRQTYAFATTDGENVMSYACAPSPSEGATLARAQQAHAYAQAELERVGRAAADAMFEGIDQGASSLSTSISINTMLDREAERIANTTEEQFQCFMFDVQDA